MAGNSPSRSIDLTLLTCVPKLRCTPLQRMHKVMPRFQLAHFGFAALQSAQRSFPDRVANSATRRALRAFDSAVVTVLVARSGTSIASPSGPGWAHVRTAS